VVQEHLETWLATIREADPDGDPVPWYVEEAFRKFTTCKIPAHGVARVHCARCKLDYLVAFSCRARGLCPSCSTRYMVETAAHLVDSVLPRVPYRQWVLTVPKRVRYFLKEPRHASAVLRIYHRALEATIRNASRDQAGQSVDAAGRVGLVTFLQRFGASLNPHVHAHSVTSDGVFVWAGEGNGEGDGAEGEAAREVVFCEATELTVDAVEDLTETIRHRVLRYLVRQGLIDDWTAEEMLQWQGHGGFSVNDEVRVEAWDRMALERLIRYCARPTFSQERLHRLDDQTLIYQLPRPDIRGRTELVLTPQELLQRLADLLPPPRTHRHRYFGCFAPNAAMRSAVVATAGPDEALGERMEQAAAAMGPGEAQEDGPRPASARWAMLIARIHEALPLLCPRCQAPMSIVSFITDPSVVARLLQHMGEPSRPPELSPARSPPQTELEWDDDIVEWDEPVDADIDDIVDQTSWP